MPPKKPPLVKKVIFDVSKLNIADLVDSDSDSDTESELSDLPSNFGEGDDGYSNGRDSDDNEEWHELSSTEDEGEDEEPAPILPLPKAPPRPEPTPILPGAKSPAPLPPPPPAAPKEHTIGARLRAVTMMDDGEAVTKITRVTGIPRTRVYEFHARARERGWVEKTKSGEQMILEPHHVANATRSGRPSISPEAIACIIKVVTKNSTSRGYSTAEISKKIKESNYHVAPRTVWKILKAEGYNQCKLTVKPGLQDLNKKERLAWCLEREHWTLEQWRDVIFSDETSVQLAAVRGKRRVWRKPEEQFEEKCIRRRWKGFQEFMFWGCFTYDKKGPCHVWKKQSAADKQAMNDDLDARNKRIEVANRRKWQKKQREWLKKWIDDHKGNRPGGVRKKWVHSEENGAFVVKPGRGGINWYRYQKEILVAKLLPFAKECIAAGRPNTQVQEDNAPAHASKYQGEVYNLWQIMKMIWPANSPDLNAIERCWFWMKKETTKRGATSSKAKLRKRWIKCWDKLPQKMIQQWIEAIPHHVAEIIRLKGSNEYKEGRKKGEEKKSVY